jgi:hypothetical protein
MLNTLESTDFFANLKKSLSIRRFSGYCGKGSDLDAFAKYLWNIHLCESLCPCFQLLKVAFRNKVHCQIGLAIKDPNWILNEHGIIYEKGREAIKGAKESLEKDGAIITEDLLVSEMKFGFWTSLLNSQYDRLWPKIIAEVFPNMPKTIRTRGNVSVLMNGVRKLRNAALHHHSIWHWDDLKERHNQIRALIGYICFSSSITADEIDRFPTVQSNGNGECQKIASKILSSIQKPVEEIARD